MQYDFAKLRAVRIRKRMTQTELARRTGLSNAAISQIERGNGPWLKAIREIEQVLGIKDVIKEEKTA